MAFVLKPLNIEDRLDLYDLVVVAAGFETRAKHVSKELGLRGRSAAAIGFPDRQELAYADNVRWFEDSGFAVDTVSDDNFSGYFHGLLGRAKGGKRQSEATVCVDVSSFSRPRLAHIVRGLQMFGQLEHCRVHFYYNIAQYSDPPVDVLGINTHAGPVLPEFAGWSAGPDFPPIALVGMGYEEGKALGAVEYLQADEIWAFDPVSPIEKYRDALEKANSTFVELVSAPRLLTYDVMDPIDLFERLEALVFAAKGHARPHILPFGPKIFALVGLLVATLHREAAVWRVSAGPTEIAADRQPSAFTLGLEMLLSPE